MGSPLSEQLACAKHFESLVEEAESGGRRRTFHVKHLQPRTGFRLLPRMKRLVNPDQKFAHHFPRSPFQCPALGPLRLELMGKSYCRQQNGSGRRRTSWARYLSKLGINNFCQPLKLLVSGRAHHADRLTANADLTRAPTHNPKITPGVRRGPHPRPEFSRAERASGSTLRNDRPAPNNSSCSPTTQPPR
jgi:hypothetical protein